MEDKKSILLKSAMIMLLTIGVVVMLQTLLEWKDGREDLLLYSGLKFTALIVGYCSVFYTASRKKPIIAMAILAGIAIVFSVIFIAANIHIMGAVQHSVPVMVISHFGDMIIGVVATWKGWDYGEFRKRKMIEV